MVEREPSWSIVLNLAVKCANKFKSNELPRKFVVKDKSRLFGLVLIWLRAHAPTLKDMGAIISQWSYRLASSRKH